MAGPGVHILVPARALPVEPLIAASLEQVGLRRDEDALPEYFPKLRDRDDLPYDLEVEQWPSEPDYIDIDTAAGIETAIGLRPSLDVLLIAQVNDDRAHRVLGEFAAELAARTEGWIDLNGPLRPRSLYPHETLLARFRLRLYIAKLALPGEVRSVEHQTPAGGRSSWSFLDAEAMRAWLRHRDFHMIK
jgi:hypothetical protein